MFPKQTIPNYNTIMRMSMNITTAKPIELVGMYGDVCHNNTLLL